MPLLFSSADKEDVTDDWNADKPKAGFYHTNDQDGNHDQPVPPGNFFKICPSQPKQKN